MKKRIGWVPQYKWGKVWDPPYGGWVKVLRRDASDQAALVTSRNNLGIPRPTHYRILPVYVELPE